MGYYTARLEMSSDWGLDVEWRDHVLRALRVESEPSVVRQTVAHALRVKRAVLRVLAEPEYKSAPELDRTVLLSAALLHSLGRPSASEVWLPEQLGRSDRSLARAQEILANNEAFQRSPDRVQLALHLIEHLDDTMYGFPFKGRRGRPAQKKLAQEQCGLRPELALLREADGLVHVEEAEIGRAIETWLQNEIPYFAEHGPALNSWMWHDCVSGNIRLAGKRAVLDASTARGRQLALRAYDRLEGMIKEQCELRGVSYQPEISPPEFREASVERMADRAFCLEIVAFHGWHSLAEELRSCTLRYDESIRPYEAARICSKTVEIEALTPLALYVLENRLEDVQELHDALMVEYCFGLWDLPGWMEFRYSSSDVQVIAPPIVEEYTEDMAFPTPKTVAGLLDGLHRCVAARRMGVQRVLVLVAKDVPYPLVPLPATWAEVQVVRKRKYRYNSLDQFPDISEYSQAQVTEDNFRYFFFRDLQQLGSRGERTYHEFDELRAD